MLKWAFIHLQQRDWKHCDIHALFDLVHQNQALVHFTESYLHILSFPAEGVNNSGKGVITPFNMGFDVFYKYFSLVYSLSSVQKQLGKFEVRWWFYWVVEEVELGDYFDWEGVGLFDLVWNRKCFPHLINNNSKFWVNQIWATLINLFYLFLWIWV